MMVLRGALDSLDGGADAEHIDVGLEEISNIFVALNDFFVIETIAFHEDVHSGCRYLPDDGDGDDGILHRHQCHRP